MLVENGYHPLPILPGSKIPGICCDGYWRPMPGWTRFCDKPIPSPLLKQWLQWPGADISVAHGRLVALDVDIDEPDVIRAVERAVASSPARRFGSKGYVGYYRVGCGMEKFAARLRWCGRGSVACELLLHGTQSVLPPTLHPATGYPYRWITEKTLLCVGIDELPEFDPTHAQRLDRELGFLGLVRTVQRDGRARRIGTKGGRSDLSGDS